MYGPVAEVCPQHEKLAVGEVEHIHNAEDERQAHGHQGINNANGKAVNHLLDKKCELVHFQRVCLWLNSKQSPSPTIFEMRRFDEVLFSRINTGDRDDLAAFEHPQTGGNLRLSIFIKTEYKVGIAVYTLHAGLGKGVSNGL